MIICENCGAELPDGAKFCHNCGNTVADVPVKQDLGEKCAYFKADGLRYAILNGEAVVFNQLGESAETVTVPDVVNYNGKVYDVTAISKDAFKDCKRLSQIVTGNKVTEIGEEAFSGCTILKSITIGEGVKTIGKDAFAGCGKLVRVNYTGDLKNWCEIDGINFLMTASDRALFVDGRELEGGIAIPDGAKKIGSGAFRYCSKITDIVIPKSVTSIGFDVFEGCKNLKMICYTGDLASWCGIEWLYALTKTRCAIYVDGKELSGDLVIPDGVTSIGNSAFYSCSGLTSVTIPDGVTSIGNSAFTNCSRLTSISIPDGVTSIGSSAFRDCSALTSITIPNSVTSIGNCAFEGCSQLKKIYYKGTKEDWAKIGIGTEAIAHKVKICYYSENKPKLSLTTKYWHFAADGKTPEIW